VQVKADCAVLRRPSANALIHIKLPFDVTRDFKPVSLLAAGGIALEHIRCAPAGHSVTAHAKVCAVPSAETTAERPSAMIRSNAG
jgi:hypothetical protein